MSKSSPSPLTESESTPESPATEKVRQPTTTEWVFIENYLRTWNQTKSYQAAHPNCRYTTARTNGSRLLAKANIKAAIQARLTEMHMGADEVLKLLADQARGDMADLMSLSTVGFTLDLVNKDPETGELKPKPQTKLIKRIEQKTTIYSGKREDEDREEHILKLELYDAQAALALIGKHHKLFTDRTEVTGKDGQPLTPETMKPSEIAAIVSALLQSEKSHDDTRSATASESDSSDSGED